MVWGDTLKEGGGDTRVKSIKVIESDSDKQKKKEKRLSAFSRE